MSGILADCRCVQSSDQRIKTKIHQCCFSLTLWFLRGAQDPIPSRTRPSNSSAPMVLSLKTWESRSLQGLPKTALSHYDQTKQKSPGLLDRGFFTSGIPMQNIAADCSKCFALCCTALSFERGSQFGHDKPAGQPCQYLA